MSVRDGQMRDQMQMQAQKVRCIYSDTSLAHIIH